MKQRAALPYSMPLHLMLTALTLATLIGTPVLADDYAKSAKSGQRIQVHSYANWDRSDCTSKTGTVEVRKFPQHGTISNVAGQGVIQRSRTSLNPLCKGRPVGVLRVYYKSAATFSGSDHFQLQITNWRGKQRLDNFTIRVQ